MDTTALLLGAIIGAFVSVPVTLFVTDPLRLLIRRVRLGTTEFDVHAAREAAELKQLEAELEVRKGRMERARAMVDNTLPPQRDNK